MGASRAQVLCLSGHDPCGGAGIQADIESCMAHGVLANSLVTALTVQNTQGMQAFEPVPSELLQRQLDTLQADTVFDAIKLGVIGSMENLRLIAEFIRTQQVPVVLDPVIRASRGNAFADENLTQALRQQLLPHCMLITPNQDELQQLAPEVSGVQQQAQLLLEEGCGAVLVTSAESSPTELAHRLFLADGVSHPFVTERLDGEFHGSGCTLAATAAALLARGFSVHSACEQAIQFTLATLYQADQPGQGQFVPNRSVRG